MSVCMCVYFEWEEHGTKMMNTILVNKLKIHVLLYCVCGRYFCITRVSYTQSRKNMTLPSQLYNKEKKNYFASLAKIVFNLLNNLYFFFFAMYVCFNNCMCTSFIMDIFIIKGETQRCHVSADCKLVSIDSIKYLRYMTFFINI